MWHTFQSSRGLKSFFYFCILLTAQASFSCTILNKGGSTCRIIIIIQYFSYLRSVSHILFFVSLSISSSFVFECVYKIKLYKISQFVKHIGPAPVTFRAATYWNTFRFNKCSLQSLGWKGTSGTVSFAFPSACNYRADWH